MEKPKQQEKDKKSADDTTENASFAGITEQPAPPVMVYNF
jgi:hypothetical protein